MLSYINELYIERVPSNEFNCEANLYKMSDIYGQIKKKLT